MSRAEEEAGREASESIFARTRRAIAASAWTPIAGKAAAYLAGFALLGLVGSGRLMGWLSPPSRLVAGIAVAEASAAPPATAKAAEPAVESPTDAGAPPADGGAETSASDGGAPAPAVGADGKVALNLATEEDLRRLPGVGPTRAKAILALRARLGKIKRVEDLLRVKGIGRRSLARLRPLVRVD
jgi:competence protein ComEA